MGVVQLTLEKKTNILMEYTTGRYGCALVDGRNGVWNVTIISGMF
jgi:hypothetical protein